jgi:hypothetical protein
MKIRSVRAQVFHAGGRAGGRTDGQTDMTKLKVALRNFANASKNRSVNCVYRGIIAVCSEIHTKHINTLCGQNVEFVNVKPGGT